MAINGESWCANDLNWGELDNKEMEIVTEEFSSSDSGKCYLTVIRKKRWSQSRNSVKF